LVAASRFHASRRHVHEALKVRQAASRAAELRCPVQLPHHSQRHHPLPHHLFLPPHRRDRVHARRSHVLRPLPDPRPVRLLPPPPEALRLSGRPPRVGLHRRLSLPRPLPLPLPRLGPRLRAGTQPRTQLHPAPLRPPVAQDHYHPWRRDHPDCLPLGFLGLRPLPSHPARHPPRPCRVRHHFLPCPEGRGPPQPFVSHPAPPRPPCAEGRLHCHLCVRPRCSHSARHRSRRVRPHPVLQARVLLGDRVRLGQPRPLRPFHRPPPAPDHLLPLPLPPRSSLPLGAPPHPRPHHRRRLCRLSPRLCGLQDRRQPLQPAAPQSGLPSPLDRRPSASPPLPP
ncbi:putative movement protein, partial [Grapevine asteroid mosaic associated virus]